MMPRRPVTSQQLIGHDFSENKLPQTDPGGPGGAVSRRVAANGEQPMVLTVDEAAELLRVERKTLYDAIGRGEVPGVRRIGRLIRLSRNSVLEWLASGKGAARRAS